MDIELLDKIAPKNDGFVGMIDAKQVLGGGVSGTLPDACVAASTVAQHESSLDHDQLINTHNLTSDIDHDQLTNSFSDEHFTQEQIDTISTALASGFVRVTTGTGALSSLATIDISDHTNLSANSPITLSGDAVGFDFSTNNTWTGTQTINNDVTIGTDKKLKLRDANAYLQSTASGQVTLTGTVKTTIGATGDTEIGDTTEGSLRPNTPEKVNLGLLGERII